MGVKTLRPDVVYVAADDTIDYRITIRSQLTVDLHVWVFYFDNSDLSIGEHGMLLGYVDHADNLPWNSTGLQHGVIAERLPCGQAVAYLSVTVTEDESLRPTYGLDVGSRCSCPTSPLRAPESSRHQPEKASRAWRRMGYDHDSDCSAQARIGYVLEIQSA